ncbi:MAG: DUF3095 domain-containing protein [Symploca sp. SIO1C2]|nr:DUF3095 domain-containing protein [Symploca sp. SIO1C2]
MSTDYFYTELPTLASFLDITDSDKFQSAPRDWYIVITDIVGSTQAIESGRYKDVNLLGASSIVAVLNIAGNLEIPFIFGGDGASLLIPPSLFAKTRLALLATSQWAKTEFKMDLRIGAVPVSVVTAANYKLKVAKIKISDDYCQAAFTGNGLNYATKLVKDAATAELYTVGKEARGIKADFSGLECRWQDICSTHGEMVSLIVSANSSDCETNNQTYQELIREIYAIYGQEDCWNPVNQKQLKLAFSYKYLKSEVRLRAKSGKLWHKILYFWQILLENCLGWLLMRYKVKLADSNWGAYKNHLIMTTDYQKFEDMLKMTLDGNRQQREQLTRYLEDNYRKGKLVYGLQVSERALMTCLVFERHGQQVHFVDGADGGYAAAAKEMKKRLIL